MIDASAHTHAPLYMTDLAREIEALGEAERQLVTLVVTVDADGRHRALDFWVPRAGAYPDALIDAYVLAMMNNMMVSFAGASMDIHFDTSDGWLAGIVGRAIAAFQLGNEKNTRTGYGVYVNYTNRMNRFLGLGRFRMRMRDRADVPPPDPARAFFLYTPGDREAERACLRRCASDLDGKCLCSLDVGGNSIKGAVVSDGRIAALKEHRWYPTGIKWADEMNGAQLTMIRLLALISQAIKRGMDDRLYRAALAPSADLSALEDACRALKSAGLSAENAFDAVVIGFPDIVVGGQIAGGESFKHQGMKHNPAVDYEEEFFKTSGVGDLARAYVKQNGAVVVLNDGNAASYITSVEQAFVEESIIDDYGLFANTIGTEMGTGFISVGGTIQHVPLEGFQHVIDLGSLASARRPACDVRSTASMNTGIPGTVQKFISQLGLFRMCVAAYEREAPDVIDRLIEQNLLERDGDVLRVPVAPVDRRGELTRWLVERLDLPDPVVARAFRGMGKALGVLIDLDRAIFPEIAPTRLLSGGIVADDRAFALIAQGLHEHNAEYRVLRLDETTMRSPLLKSMEPGQRHFSVAIGSAYIGNRFLTDLEAKEQR